MPPQALAAVATMLSLAPHGNRIELHLDRGSAELMWATPGTFRFRRVLEGPLPPVAWTDREPVAIRTEGSPDEVRFRSKALEVTIRKQGLLVRVRRLDGAPLMNDLSPPRSEAGGVTWERQTLSGVAFYGLGPRTDPVFDTRGKSFRAETPFLICTAGYGEYHPGAGSYRFDFTREDRYRVQGPDIDYFFYFGPTPKEIFEEHNSVRGQAGQLVEQWQAEPRQALTDRFGSWTGLRAGLLRLVHGAMSAATGPTFDLAPYNNAPPDLMQRARQIGSLVAHVMTGTVGASLFRQQLDTFYGSYVAELQDRGYPVWHPLPFQFPNDPESARHTDEFMLGDEMLIAPICDPTDKRSVYLPRGIWTSLETNQAITGPQTITVETKGLPVFARNGTIVPLDSPGGGMALHYFPKLGAEFFLLEGDIAEYSQVHAAPAADIMRLEIESRKDRDYQWVVHHLEKPSAVEFEDRKYSEAPALNVLADRTWFYDSARRNLHVRVKVKAGEDIIINLSF